MNSQMKKSDVCLVLEGTYPYVPGGVSQWTHDLIRAQKDLTFFLVCILPRDANYAMRYKIPNNVIGIQNIFLQRLPRPSNSLSVKESKHFFESLEVPILNLQYRPKLKDLSFIIDLFNQFKSKLNGYELLDSTYAWNMTQRMYLSTMGESSFLNFFWSTRGLLASFYSILLADLPQASVYHTLCTGYAGLFATRAFLELKRPCIITEHGIYTNERRIEITSVDWLEDQKAFNLNIEKHRFERDLKDYWIDTFSAYSKLCYEACRTIITLYEGNKSLQQADGADPNKLVVIPNGVNYEQLSKIEHKTTQFQTVALIGRVVPIKDVKSFIRAISLLKPKIPHLRAWVLGAADEDPDYYQECVELVKNNGLQDVLTFLGKVNIEDYLAEIDLLVLTSISESQPLVILEGGAVGIPSIASDVGACREMILGRPTESPYLGPGGLISQLSNPESVADNIFLLLSDRQLYKKSSRAIQKRVQMFYDKNDLEKTYRELYQSLMQEV